MEMRLKELLELGEVEETQGELDQLVTGLTYDSREVKQGYVFFAVPGAHFDGHEFVAESLGRGACAVVVERTAGLPHGATWIRVRDVRRTMGLWAASFFAYPSRRLLLVGVTGTNGKTTVTYLLESIFSSAGMVSGVIGTINYRYQGQVFPALHTTPESVDLQTLFHEMVEAGVRSVAMEVSSHALDQERVRGIDFDGAVFTNLSHDHLDFHGDMEHYFASKARLFTDYLSASQKGKKFAVIYGEDPRGRELLGTARALGFGAVSYGQGTDWDIHPLEIEGDLDGLRGKVRVKDQSLHFASRLIGSANLQNILGAVGVGSALGLPHEVISEGIARLESVPGRLERIENRHGISVLVDYAHTPDALEKVLLGLRELMPKQAPATNVGTERRKPRLICVFGCGGDRDRGKRPLMGQIAGQLSDLVVLTSDNSRSEEPCRILEEIEEGVRKTGMPKFPISDFRFPISDLKSKISNRKSEKGYCVEPDRRVAIGLAVRQAHAGDLVLIAGKGHEDYQILGSRRIHFDDREVAREELSQLSAVGSQQPGKADS